MIGESYASRFFTKNVGQLVARATGWGSGAMAQVEAEAAERARSGRIFNGQGIAAGLAPVQAIPTTSAAHLLYNADANLTYAVDVIGTWLASGTATAGLSLYGIVTSITATLPAAATGSLISNASNSNRLSRAVFASGYTIPTPAGMNQWFCIGTSNGGVPGVGGGYSYDVKGKIFIPPGKALGLTVVAGAGTSPLYVPTATWTEGESDNE